MNKRKYWRWSVKPAQRWKIIVRTPNKFGIEGGITPAAKLYFIPIQDVRVYRESNRSWEGRFKISRMSGDHNWVSYGKSTKQFGYTQEIPQPAYVEDLELAMLLKQSARYRESAFPTLLIQLFRWVMFQRSINLRKKEIFGLIDKGSFKLVEKDVIKEESNVRGGRFL